MVLSGDRAAPQELADSRLVPRASRACTALQRFPDRPSPVLADGGLHPPQTGDSGSRGSTASPVIKGGVGGRGGRREAGGRGHGGPGHGDAGAPGGVRAPHGQPPRPRRGEWHGSSGPTAAKQPCQAPSGSYTCRILYIHDIHVTLSIGSTTLNFLNHLIQLPRCMLNDVVICKNTSYIHLGD